MTQRRIVVLIVLKSGLVEVIVGIHMRFLRGLCVLHLRISPRILKGIEFVCRKSIGIYTGI